MKIAFDLDDTLDHSALRDMLLALMGSPNCTVAVISAGRTNLERKRRQLRYLGIPDSVELDVAEGSNPPEWAEAKARWLVSRGFDVFVEDRPDFCKAVRRLAPSIVVLQVRGPRVKRSHDALGEDKCHH